MFGNEVGYHQNNMTAGAIVLLATLTPSWRLSSNLWIHMHFKNG